MLKEQLLIIIIFCFPCPYNMNSIEIFKSNDGKIEISVTLENDTVWLNRQQLSELFDRDIKTIENIFIMYLRMKSLIVIQLSQNLRQFKPKEPGG